MNKCIIVLHVYYNFYLFKFTFCDTKTLYCPFVEPLSGISKMDKYNLVYVKKGDNVIIPCCQRHRTEAYKTWFKNDRFMKQKINDSSVDHWQVSDTFVLTIEEFSKQDSGAYHCTDIIFSESDNYYYLIDVVPELPVIFGDLKGYKQYLETNLKPIQSYLENYRATPELLDLYQKTGLILVANLRFEEWSACDACKKEKKRIGHCHLEPRLSRADLCGKQCEFYKFALSVDCGATWTLKNMLPNVAQKVKQIPDFVRIVKCIGYCSDIEIPGVEVDKKFKLQYMIVGSTVQLVCPYYSIRKKCHWTRDDSKLPSSIYDADAKVSVNEFSVLLIKEATVKESGEYTCYLDGKLVTHFKIVVGEEFSEKNALWWRHVNYLTYIILLCFIVLVAGLVIGALQRNSYIEIDVEEAIEEFLRRKFDHEKLEPPSGIS